MESNYFPAFPSTGAGAVDPGVRQFVTTFYETSDRAELNDAWVDLFADGATLIVGSAKGQGKEEIAKIRRGMWDKVSRRGHVALQAFPAAAFDDGGDNGGSGSGNTAEVMLVGRVNYALKAGGVDTKDWASHMRLVREGPGAPWRLSYYRVYI